MSRVCVDRGGTFTDVVTIGADGRAHIAKVPSDRAVLGALLDARGADGAALTFGTTVATNALLERRGVATLLVVSPGFEDLVALRDMARPELFDPDADRPPSLASAVVAAGATLAALDLSRFGAAAVVLLDGDDEATAAELRALAPHLYVTTGASVSRELGYLARIETTLVDAALTPVLAASLARDRIPPGALAMRSDGSLTAASELRAHEAVLSGPAGGVLATLAVARDLGFSRAVGLDMGGTSTDVCLVDVAAGPPRREGDLEVAGVRLRRAMLEVETIAAGGGSICAADGFGLAVGPASAGAAPGPQCYGRGGPPTITDAALVLGLIEPARFPMPLFPERIALPGEGSAHERAAALVDVARAAMADAVRRLAMQRGVDVAGHALVAYGGAAGQHAAAVAERLGIAVVLVHPAASVFCAWGQSLARQSESRRTAYEAPLGPAADPFAGIADALAARFAELERELPTAGVERFVSLGYAGTDHPIDVPCTDACDMIAAFEAETRTRYGFVRDLPIALFGLSVRVLGPEPTAARIDDDPFGLGARVVAGPTVLHADTTSVHVPAGWSARLDRGVLRLDHAALGTARREPPLHAWQARLTAIASEAGVVLARLARSVSIRERLDFSCALFDGDGRLVTNAPHIPVHLGAMGDTVRDVARALGDDPGVARALGDDPDAAHDGDAWLTNDPAAGGSHLPDLTVITLVRSGARRFFVASRGHHVDVGGIAPGSMPVRSRCLADEGLRFRRAPLVRRGALVDLMGLVSGSRQPETVAADLLAQLAANAHMARRLRELDPGALATAMAALYEQARAGTEHLVAALPASDSLHATDEIDGVPLALRLARDPHGALVVDFTGTGGPHPGNLNAPPAVVRAALLYALRVVLREPRLPLNDGTLQPVTILAPRPSIVAPPPDAAIVGGNVETSQRIVDLCLAALGERAASAGTMNNLVLARDPSDPDPREWAFYETLGGGFGASARGPGRSARQIHMTNTRATDPEVLAARLPLRVVRFAIRRGSGGGGLHRGGDGLVRELEVRRPTLASLLVAWRPDGAPGLAGGGAGQPGAAFVQRRTLAPAPAPEPQPWSGEPIHLAPGDRVIIFTPGGGGYGALPTPTSSSSPSQSPSPTEAPP